MQDSQLLRYSRQIMLPQMDVAGQQKLLDAKVLVVGLGGLGSPVALYLAAAGVGQLILADFDVVEESNLQRQIIHHSDSIGEVKVKSALRQIKALNPDVKVRTITEKLKGKILEEQVSQVNLVLDCTDNFEVRFALNKACVENRTPLVSGAAIRMEGQVSVFDSRKSNSPCYQCFIKDGQDVALNCSESGVLAPLVGIVGSIQATEALKVLAHIGKPLIGKLLLIDAMTMQMQELAIKKDPHCLVCCSA